MSSESNEIMVNFRKFDDEDYTPEFKLCVFASKSRFVVVMHEVYLFVIETPTLEFNM